MATPQRALATAASTDLADGSYLIDVTLDGGSGRASVDSPTTLLVEDGTATATLTWSSPHYDYMIVDGQTYQPTNTEGNSIFEIPVLAFDEPFDVVADTTAMSVPHEIDYQLTFDTASAKAVDTGSGGSGLLPAACGGAALVAAGCAWYLRRKRRA